jgi:hypothetical protein
MFLEQSGLKFPPTLLSGIVTREVGEEELVLDLAGGFDDLFGCFGQSEFLRVLSFGTDRSRCLRNAGIRQENEGFYRDFSTVSEQTAIIP